MIMFATLDVNNKVLVIEKNEDDHKLNLHILPVAIKSFPMQTLILCVCGLS